MNTRTLTLTLTALILLATGLPAAAEFQTKARAIEVALSDMQVPVTPTASLIFRECSSCDARVIPMTRDTAFIVNGKNVGLKEFRKVVFGIRDRDAETIIVKHHLESNTVTSLKISL